MKKLPDRMETMVKNLLGSDGKQIGRDAEGFQKKFESYLVNDSIYASDDGADYTTSALVAKYLKALSDSGYNADVEFATDKSLIFSDGSYYMRGLITLTVYNYDNQTDLSCLMPVEIKKGESIQFVSDIAFIYGNETRLPEDIRICSIENIKLLGEEGE